MFRTIRNHWKKSLFAFCALAYGGKWSYDRHVANEIRRFYCRQAALLGSQSFPSMSRLSRVAVLLNGKANNGKAKSIFDKTVFPLLHLIGLDVRVYRVDTVANAAALGELLTDKIEPNELSGLVIIGGDGTLSELAPHLLKSSTLSNLPTCVIPIGEHVSFARTLFPMATNKKKLHDDVAVLCESVLALFNGSIVQRSLLKITMSNNSEKPIYASTLDFGYYSRLEQVQKRLWYFSFLKYPIASIYLYLTNPTSSLLPVENPSINYIRSCPGCLRCKPMSAEQTNVSTQRPSYFSRVYQSNRSLSKSTATPQPVLRDNPDCGLEYCVDVQKDPVQLWITAMGDQHEFRLDVADTLARFTYDILKIERLSTGVQRVRFYPNPTLVKHLFIDHEKIDLYKDNIDKTETIECRVELAEKPLRLIQANSESLLARKSTLKPTPDELDEDALEQTGIFIFKRRHSRSMPSS